MDRAPGPPSSPPPAYAYMRGHEILQSRAHAAEVSAAGALTDDDDNTNSGGGNNSRSNANAHGNSSGQELTAAVKSDQHTEAMLLLRAGDNMGELHTDTLKSIFALLDSDHDGKLDDAEVQQALMALGLPPHRALVDDIKSHVPAWIGCDKVDFATFQRVTAMWLKSNPVLMSDIQEVFRIFKEQGISEGSVTETALRHIMGLKPAMAASLTPDEIDEIFAELGIRRRDVIDYREFMQEISGGFVGFE